jgi:hypothetical protein
MAVEEKEGSLTLKVVSKLLENYTDKWHTVFFDSFFIFFFLPVCRYLHKKKFNFIAMKTQIGQNYQKKIKILGFKRVTVPHMINLILR